MKANLDFVINSNVTSRQSQVLKHLGACAITPSNYYYIPYDPMGERIESERPTSSNRLPNPDTVDEINPVYVVTRARWNIDPADWENNREKIADQVIDDRLSFRWRNE